MGTGSFPGVESGRGVTLTPHPVLVPRSKNRLSYTSNLPKGLHGLWKGWNLPTHSTCSLFKVVLPSGASTSLISASQWYLKTASYEWCENSSFSGTVCITSYHLSFIWIANILGCSFTLNKHHVGFRNWNTVSFQVNSEYDQLQRISEGRDFTMTSVLVTGRGNSDFLYVGWIPTLDSRQQQEYYVLP
jgi:hypothetical protein